MFFDDEDVSHSLFGDREVIQHVTTTFQHHQMHQNSFNNAQVMTANNTTTLNHRVMRQDVKLKNHNLTNTGESFAETYCSDVALQSVLDRTSMSYQIPTNHNLLGSNEKSELHSVNTNFQLKSDFEQDRNKRVRTQWEVPNSVYCTHQGLDTILETSSMSYHCNNVEHNTPLLRESPLQRSYDEEEDKEYLLAFGREVDSRQKNQRIEESLPEVYPSPPPPSYETYHEFDEQSLDFAPKVYFEGIDDFDVFTLFPMSDEAI